ncbi:superoxide dismutase [Mn], mitochondrial [Trichomonascus vanleenenianus]|uniref:superoxide dismutase n=1 Tax=Trichomonascus vanleenenianus TaxID=2268995 RepID=UPI003EC98883
MSNTTTVGNFVLPPLPYEYAALEPHISAQIMKLHHDVHHKAYVTNLNAAIKEQGIAYESNNITAQIEFQSKIKFNGGGHINHSLFWQNLAPANSTDVHVGHELKHAIEQEWGSFDKFEAEFTQTLMGIQGSGWGWLIKRKDGSLALATTQNQDPVTGDTPLIGIDFWEHSYYLQYYTDKASYVKNIYQVLNWKTAEDRYKHGASLKLL